MTLLFIVEIRSLLREMRGICSIWRGWSRLRTYGCRHNGLQGNVDGDAIDAEVEEGPAVVNCHEAYADDDAHPQCEHVVDIERLEVIPGVEVGNEVVICDGGAT